MLRSFNFVNFNWLDMLAPINPCSLSAPFLETATMHMMTLPLFCVILMVAFFIAHAYGKCFKRRDNDTTADGFGNLQSRTKKTFLTVVFFLYPGIGTRVFRTFKCLHILGEAWLTADMSVRCWEGQHSQSVALMVVCVFVYVIGIPVASVLILYRNQSLIVEKSGPIHANFGICHLICHKKNSPLLASQLKRQKKQFKDTYGQLFEAYKPKHWYFEAIEMVKKQILAGGLVLVAPGSPVQVLLAIIVALAFLVTVLHTKPYADVNDNKIQAFATIQLILLLLVGLVLKTDRSGPYETVLLSVLLVLVYMSVVVLGVLSIFFMMPVRQCYGRGKTFQVAALNHGLLEKTSIFGNLPRTSIRRILHHMRYRKYEGEGKFIERQGKIGDEMMLIVTGKMEVWKDKYPGWGDPDALEPNEVKCSQSWIWTSIRTIVCFATRSTRWNTSNSIRTMESKYYKVHSMEAPDVVGEAALMNDHYKRSASLVCGTPVVEVLSLRRKDYRKLVHDGIIDSVVVERVKIGSMRFGILDKNGERKTGAVPAPTASLTKVAPAASPPVGAQDQVHEEVVL